MSPLDWFQRLFSSGSEEGDLGPASDPAVVGQHIRVVLAILVCIISGFVIWWLLV